MTGNMQFKTLSALLFVVGCADTSVVEKTAVVDQGVTANNGVSLNGVSLNGVSLNGVSLNGVSLNGVSLNGVSLNGVSLNGVSLNGVSLNGVSLNGVSLNGVSLNGVSLNGVSLNGATMTATLSDGSPLELRIDDATWESDERISYAVSANVDGGWQPLCGTEADGSAKRAIVEAGDWNTTTGAWSNDGTKFTFACRGSSIAKCHDMGYVQWNGYSDHHHACVRMLRADYCGDGVSHTVDGTPVNLYDNVGVQADTESWSLDGEWNADGSLCFNHYRGGSMPSCSSKYSTSCGSFANGALIINERQ